jgi:hypothetical protein
LQGFGQLVADLTSVDFVPGGRGEAIDPQILLW